MIKKLIFISVLFYNLSSFAHDLPVVVVEKNIHNFLVHQKNVIKVKNTLWQVTKDLRDIARIERWSNDRLEAHNFEAQKLRQGLSYRFKRLSEYEDEEFAKEFELAEKVLQDVQDLSQEITEKLENHYSMNVLFTDMSILVEKANNRVRQLYKTQKVIDNVYRLKRKNIQDTASDLLKIGFLERRVRTQDLLKKISKIDLEVKEIKKIRKGDFVLFKHSYHKYDIVKSKERLLDLKHELVALIEQLEIDLEEDRVTQKAIFLL